MSSHWRTTGITYLQYVQMASAAARNCLKQPLREQVQARGAVHFRERVFSNTRLQETRACAAIATHCAPPPD